MKIFPQKPHRPFFREMLWGYPAVVEANRDAKDFGKEKNHERKSRASLNNNLWAKGKKGIKKIEREKQSKRKISYISSSYAGDE
jgi:hypothetical protein